MAIDLKLIDKLLADYKKPEDIIGENGLLKQLTKALLERAMQAEMTDHLGYEKHESAGHCLPESVKPTCAGWNSWTPEALRVWSKTVTLWPSAAMARE